MKGESTVVVMDDEDFVRESLAEVIQEPGARRVLTAASTEEALERISTEEVDVVVADLQMPCGGAQALLDQLDGDDPSPPVIVITGVGTVPRAVAAMKAGAFDFVQKPVDPDALVLLIERALAHNRLLDEVRFLRRAVGARRHGLVGTSAEMRRLRGLIDQVAGSDVTLLITGESGTGKELVAEEIHHRGPRARGNLVRVNCAAIPESLFESEFFGHRRGSFSGATENREGRFAEAAGGTLVLDEVTTLRPEMQAKLLRVLESGEYQVVGAAGTRVADARIIAISNEPVEQLVEQGRFRADLYYRLAIFPLAIAPLRERKDDLGPLARHLLARLGGGPEERIELGEDVLEALSAYDWPGNVRELRNVLERSTILSGRVPPDAGLLRSVLESAFPGHVDAPPAGADESLHLRTRLNAAEKRLVGQALERSGGRRKQAAEMLGIDPRNLAYYLRKHDLSPPPPSSRGDG